MSCGSPMQAVRQSPVQVEDFPDPGSYPRSQRFREIINGQYLNPAGLDWFSDDAGESVNRPDPGEVRVLKGFEAKYKVEADNPVPRYFTQEILDEVVKAFTARRDYYRRMMLAIHEKYIHIDADVAPDLDGLPPVAQAVVKKAAVEMLPLIDELFILQQNPNLPAYYNQLQRDAATNSVASASWAFTSHIIIDECPMPLTQDPGVCSLYPVPPDGPGLSNMMPWDMTSFDWNMLTKAYSTFANLNGPEFRPDTVIEWSGGMRPDGVFDSLKAIEDRLGEIRSELSSQGVEVEQGVLLEAEIADLEGRERPLLEELVGAITYVSLPNHHKFSDVSRRISEKALELANFEMTAGGQRVRFAAEYPQVAAHLMAVSDYFRTGSFEDAERVLKTIIEQEEGDLRIAISPGTESYWADNTKYAALMWMGVLKREAKEAVQGFVTAMLVGVDQLAVRETSYDGEKKELSSVSVDTLDMFAYGGFLWLYPHGRPGGWNFPTYEGYESIDSKKMVMAQGVLKLRKNEALLAELMGPYTRYVTGFGDTAFVTGHENGHFVGPTRAYVTHSGATMGSVFGGRWGWADEPKADMVSPTAIRLMLEEDRISLEQAKEMFFTYLSWQWSRLEPEKKFERIGQSHMIGVPLEMGWWYENGLFELGDDGKGIVYNLSAPEDITKEELLRWLRVGEELFLKIVDYQAKGGVDEYVAFAQGIADRLPDEFVAFVKGAIERTQTKRKFIMFTGLDTGRVR